MATTYFLNMNGRTFGQVAPGASCMYGFDHQGSVVQTVDNNGNAQNRYRYHPYGTTESFSQPATPPLYKWVGSRHYRPTGRSYSEYFVRRRSYGSRQAGWNSQDAYWPAEPPYSYAKGAPTNRVDPSGQFPTFIEGPLCLLCAWALLRELMKFDDGNLHDCHHHFVHCFTCCVLSTLFGKDCARISQALQNIHDPIEVQKSRWLGCNAGLGASHLEDCLGTCAGAFPKPDDCDDPKPLPGDIPIPDDCLPQACVVGVFDPPVKVIVNVGIGLWNAFRRYIIG